MSFLKLALLAATAVVGLARAQVGPDQLSQLRFRYIGPVDKPRNRGGQRAGRSQRVLCGGGLGRDF
jgi:hypothetical protein